MEEEKVKSAFEIAMERISSLPELTPEEIAAQNEKRYAPVGEAIAGKYLNGLIGKDELPSELDRHRGAQLPVVRRSLLKALCRTMQLQGDPGPAAKALDGLDRLVPAKRDFIEKAVAEFQWICKEFEKERKKSFVSFEASSLKPLGISGTAVRVNPAENVQCQEELKRLHKEYEPKLEGIRSALLKELQE